MTANPAPSPAYARQARTVGLSFDPGMRCRDEGTTDFPQMDKEFGDQSIGEMP